MYAKSARSNAIIAHRRLGHLSTNIFVASQRLLCRQNNWDTHTSHSMRDNCVPRKFGRINPRMWPAALDPFVLEKRTVIGKRERNRDWERERERGRLQKDDRLFNRDRSQVYNGDIRFPCRTMIFIACGILADAEVSERNVDAHERGWSEDGIERAKCGNPVGRSPGIPEFRRYICIYMYIHISRSLGQLINWPATVGRTKGQRLHRGWKRSRPSGAATPPGCSMFLVWESERKGLRCRLSLFLSLSLSCNTCPLVKSNY